jgi:hypothetical protein
MEHARVCVCVCVCALLPSCAHTVIGWGVEKGEQLGLWQAPGENSAASY